jgi:hypothetical protein
VSVNIRDHRADCPSSYTTYSELPLSRGESVRMRRPPHFVLLPTTILTITKLPMNISRYPVHVACYLPFYDLFRRPNGYLPGNHWP